jgi:hypothetical protein
MLAVRHFARRDWTSAAVLVGYVLVAFVYWGARLLPHPGRAYIGTSTDPQIFIWSIAWWPHAIAHGVNPFYTHSIWAPEGVNLAWTTSVPGIALLVAPLTWLFGAVVSYNVATLLMPGLAAWTAFLLCRHITRSLWPSLVGGYLFGFSAYMAGQIGAHMHMDSVFLLPLVALVVLRFVEGELGGRALVVRLGPMLALQLAFSTENTFTYTLALGTAIALGFLFAPSARRRLVALALPLVASYALAAVLVAPLVYYALSGFTSGSVNEPAPYTTDLLNLLVPTPRLLGGGWHLTSTISQHFPGNDGERAGYLGLPSLVIVGLFAARRWRTQAGRVLLAGFVVGIVATFGIWLVVDGHKAVTMPWEHVAYLPLFNNVLPSRLMLFVVLITAIIVALWMNSSRGWIRIALPILAVLSFIPDPSADTWKTTAFVPQFFRGGDVRRCVAPNENVLILPQSKHGYGMLWQVAAGFRFRMADGYVAPDVPNNFMTTPAIARIANRQVTWPDLVPFARAKNVTTVLVDASASDPWRSILRPLAPPRAVGGMLVYRFDKTARC